MLTLVPTPIGNLEDITLRTLKALKEADVILCEDTRMSKKLLKMLLERGILKSSKSPEFKSFHSHNQNAFVAALEPQFFEQNVIYLSDAGMPCISDPGAKLVRYAIENEIMFDILPGACALNVAFCGSGIESTPFFFAGFLPHKLQERREKIAQLAHLKINEPYSVICYESPHRILNTLDDIASLLPQTPLVLLKDLTKLHQRRYFGTALELRPKLEGHNLNGEWVVILDFSQKHLVENPILSYHEALMLDIPPKVKAKILSKMNKKTIKECYEEIIRADVDSVDSEGQK